MKQTSFPIPLTKESFNPAGALIGFCLLLHAVVWLTYFTVVEDEHQRAVEHIYRHNNSLARAFEEHVTRSLQEVDQKLRLLKGEYERAYAATPAIAAVYANAVANPLTLQVFILDAAGNVVSAARPGTFANYADRDFFTHLRDSNNNRMFIDQPLVGRVTHRQIVPMARRLNNADGSFAGVVGIGVDPAYFSKFYQDMGLGPDTVVRVVGFDGVVRASYDASISGPGQPMARSQLLDRIEHSTAGQYLSAGAMFGTPRFYSYRVLPDYPLVVQVGVDERAALAGSNARKLFYTQAAGGASALVVVYSYFLIRTLRRQRRSDELWRLAVSSANDGVWDWHIARGRTYYSHRYEAMLGFAQGGLSAAGGELRDRVHPGDRGAVENNLAEHFAGGTDFYSSEVRLRTADGSYKWFQVRGRCSRDAAGKCVRMVGTITDIDKDRRRRQALVDSRARYAALVSQSSEGIIVSDARSGRILSANPAACRMFGYTEEEMLTMPAIGLTSYGEEEFWSIMARAMPDGGMATATVERRRKDGMLIRVERTSSLISHQDQILALTTYRDLTEERKFEERIKADVKLAGEVQKAMLPGDYEDGRVAVRAVYEPYRLVSGDYYGYRWSRDGRLLSGFILDVTGHGIATALQTSAVRTVLNEELEKDRPWTTKTLGAINAKLAGYLPAGSFVAALVFTLDLENRRLTCVSAGINHFLVANREHNGWRRLAGGFLGVPRAGRFGEETLPVHVGDAFYFPTDGLFDGLAPTGPLDVRDFGATVEALGRRALRPDRRDDCSVLCVKINGFAPYPRRFVYSGPHDLERLQPSVQKTLAELFGSDTFNAEVAIGEALMNGLRHGGGVRVKINRIGKRALFRIDDDGPGFDGNSAVAGIRAKGVAETFIARLGSEHGRGIPIMLSLMDDVIYSRTGNKVLLVKKLP